MRTRYTAAALAQLVGASVVLGIGVAFLLEAALGSDGFSTLVNGLALASGRPFWQANLLVSFAMVAIAWARGTIPGAGTVVQPLVVGFAVSGAMALIPPADGLEVRVADLMIALVLVTLGVTGYLSSNTGAGPAEALALSFDPPVPFRWGYSAVQGVGALVGWLAGAAIGPGTVVVILLLGPLVDLLRRRFPAIERRRFPV